jgi:hypothetical protein
MLSVLTILRPTRCPLGLAPALLLIKVPDQIDPPPREGLRCSVVALIAELLPDQAVPFLV